MPPRKPTSRRSLAFKQKQTSEPAKNERKRKAESSKNTQKAKSKKTPEKVVLTEDQEGVDISNENIPRSANLAEDCAASTSKSASDTTLSEEERQNENIRSIPKDVSCAICLDTQSCEHIAFLPCGHSFHNLCIEIWIAKKKKCPICKTIVYDMLETKIMQNGNNDDDDDENDDGEIDEENMPLYDPEMFFTLIQVYKQS